MDLPSTNDPSPDSDGEPPHPSAASNRLRNLPQHTLSTDLARIVRNEERARRQPYSAATIYGPASGWDKLSTAVWTGAGIAGIARNLAAHYPLVRDGLVATTNYVASNHALVSALYELVR